jgi:putative aminopeptidase FrvX
MSGYSREIRTSTSPRIGPDQIRLLEQLCNACAVSGDEGEVREIVIDQIQPFADGLKVDALGNVLAIKKGLQSAQLRVMLAAHMDEVGMMITQDEGEGIFRFENIGGINPSGLTGKTIWIGHDHVPGIIGLKPIHLLENNELNNPVSKSELRIDVSPDNASKVKVGDRATFTPSFTRFGQSIRSKALDDRFGVATLIELFQSAPDHIDFLAAFTVQEEIGLRGAKVAAYTFNPDLAIVLDCTPANDLPDFIDGQFQPSYKESIRYNTRLGKGPAIYIADRHTISDPRLIRHFMRAGDKLGIPYQIRQPGGDGADAGAIHVQREGIPSVSVSVPGRYTHTSASMARLADWENTLALVYNGLKRISPEILVTEH